MFQLRSHFLFNHYQTLGLSFRATREDIKAAYLNLVKKYHPDRNANESEAGRRFREVKEAYELLSDRYKKAEYDRQISKSDPHFVKASTHVISEPVVDSERLRYFVYSLILGFPMVSVIIRFLERPANSVETGVERHKFFGQPPDIPTPLITDTLVRAYFNPFMQRWERLSQNEEAPSPLEAFMYFVREHRGLYKQSLLSGNRPIPSRDDRFEVYHVPYRLTSAPILQPSRLSR
jgi:curved DNA-binding protein CbpA